MITLFSKRKRRKSIPVQAVCRNCGTTLYSRYCHNCGQDLFAGARRKVKDLVYLAIENMLVLDVKLLITLRYLFFYPGKLSLEFVRGRIVSYVHPSKLFWFVSIIFFTLLTFQIDSSIDKATKKITKEKKEELIEVKKELKEAFSTADLPENGENAVTNDDKDGDFFSDKFQGNLHRFMTYAPYISFLLIPFSAFIFLVFFRKSNYFYVDHLAFAMHYHTFIFLLFTIYILLQNFFPSFVSTAVWFFVYIPLLYMAIALYVFYRPKIYSLIWKILLMNIIYFTGLIIFTIIMIVFVAAIYEHIHKTN